MSTSVSNSFQNATAQGATDSNRTAGNFSTAQNQGRAGELSSQLNTELTSSNQRGGCGGQSMETTPRGNSVQSTVGALTNNVGQIDGILNRGCGSQSQLPGLTRELDGISNQIQRFRQADPSVSSDHYSNITDMVQELLQELQQLNNR